jgi:NAD(P)-dependent dehydrogenase (short-subunit alcohol dehydrogenase family)
MSQCATSSVPVEDDESGVFSAMREQIPRMIEAGGGAVVNMASILAQVACRLRADLLPSRPTAVCLREMPIYAMTCAGKLSFSVR